MIGLLRAEWLRFGRRRTLWLIVIGVWLLSSALFVLGYEGSRFAENYGPFDEASDRQDAAQALQGSNLSPADLAQAIDQQVAADRAMYEQMAGTMRAIEAQYAFPRSIETIVGSSGFVDFALILATAIMLGDEFPSGTIRTVLVASARRGRVLVARYVALAIVAVVLIAGLALLGACLPLVLAALGSRFPPLPGYDASVVPRILGASLLAGLAVSAFAAFATLMVRSGSLTLVAALVYCVVEIAVIAGTSQIPELAPGGSHEWVVRLLPARSVVGLLSASGSTPSAEAPWLTLSAAVVAAWGLLLAGLAYLRFTRMDILE